MLALIAGTGALPAAVVGAVSGPVVLCQMAGFDIKGLSDTPKIDFRIETLGTLLQTLKTKGVTRVCFAGAITRPNVDPAAIDAATLPLVPRIQAAIADGDDGALRAVIGIFEEAGLAVVAAHELAPKLLCRAGILVGDPIDDQLNSGVEVALAEHAALSSGDIGQAVVVAGGRVIAREGRAGTDAMLRTLIPATAPLVTESDPFVWAADAAAKTLGALADWVSGDDGPVAQAAPALGGLLFKAPKTGQDRRADLPVIGPRTLMLAAEAGLSDIVIEAGGVMVIDRPQVCAIAKSMNIRIWSREASQ